jgi:2-polyprenyl-3-methyl-5-hydroxy-6-metoxy-1,4-benzoquinol methylase
MSKYDQAYRDIPDYFGDKPTEILTDYYQSIAKTRPVLDVGAGQGRNSLFLARHGFTVDAIDPSPVGLEMADKVAAKEKLPITTYPVGFENFRADNAPYSAILLFGVIQVIPRDKVDLLVQDIRRWLGNSGLVFIAAFSTEDPSYEESVAGHESIGKNSFITGDGDYHTYLEPNEILTVFPGFSPVYHYEGMGPIHRHGNRQPHQHAEIIAVLRN